MTLGVGNIVALVCIVISIIFAIITNQAANPLWWVCWRSSLYCGGDRRHRGAGFSLGAAKRVLEFQHGQDRKRQIH